jgi:hypothetical protein
LKNYMDIKLIPYCEIDGIRTFSDSEIAGIYDRIEKEGSAGMLFYDGCAKNRAEFVMIMKRPGTYLYIVVERENPEHQLGIIWLNRIEHRRAWLHYCFFAETWGTSALKIAKQGVEKLISLQDSKGEYLFDTFLGITPSSNRLSVRFNKMCGAIPLCNVPYGSWIDARKANETGVFFQYLRESK